MNTQPTLRLYALALHLYPAAFRARYADEMLDTARLEYVRSPNPLRFAASLAADTLRGALREHLRAASPTRPGYVAAFALFFSFLLIAASVVNQQVLRRRADAFPALVARYSSSPLPDPRAEAIREHIVAGYRAADPTQIEISSKRFLNRPDRQTIFVTFYDASGHALDGGAVLHGALLQPPHGIFDTIRARGEYKVTWQPEPGIRIALTGRPMPDGGFVIAGQSLIPGEARTARLNRLLRWMWLFAMLACAFLALTSKRRPQHRNPTSPAQK
jgi:hypothetical protein